MKQPFAEFIEKGLGRDVLLITCGLPGSWKTETAEEVSKIKGYPIVRTDLVRLDVLKGQDIFDEKVASSMENRNKVYDETFRLAGEALARGNGAIIDATFVVQSLRRRAASIAAKQGKTFVIMQTQCPREVSLARIARRSKEAYESNALTEQAYINNEKKFEKVDLEDLKSLNPGLKIVHIAVDTQHDEPEKWYVVGVNKK